jgi:WS/DGAT/MGAT family acyltransferase
MQQLSGLDASFLQMERPTAPAHVGSLVVFDPATAPEPFTFERQRALIAERLHLVKPFTRRLVSVPFNLDKPYWIEDPDFDLDFHVRHIAVPSPGGREEVAELAAHIVARPLDRSRPLWELYVVEGLEGGAVAQLTKIHHACVDGVSGAEILGSLLDVTPEPPDIAPPPETRPLERVPNQMEMLVRGAAGALTTPRAGVRLARRAAPRLPSIGRTFVPGLRRSEQYLSRPPQTAPRTPFSGVVTPHRRFAFSSLPLSEVKAVKRLLDVTVNDVVMAMCTGALRQWLIDHDGLPAQPVLAMVPISVRTPEQLGTYGNRVSAMIAALPTNEADPIRRLHLVHDEMQIAKEQHAAIPADLLQDVTQFTPPSVLALAARLISRTRIANRISLPFNVVISNVPGPQFPLYSGGARMKGIWPLSPVVDGVGLNMTLMSYDGSLDFGLLACRELVPDLWRLCDYLGDELAILHKAAVAERAD